MKLELKRFSGQSDTTLGLMFVDGEFECFTLEDEYRADKVKGETRKKNRESKSLKERRKKSRDRLRRD